MLHMKRRLMMAAAGVLAALMVFPAYGAPAVNPLSP